MRITFVLPVADMGGGTRVVASYAERLQRLGHQVCVISLPRRSPSLRTRMKALIRERRWVKKSQVRSHLDGLAVDHRVLPRPEPVTDADVPQGDVVIATWWETAEWVMQLSPNRGAKAYLVQGHEVFDYLPRDRVRATYRLPLHKITVSRWLAELMEREYGQKAISLVENGVDTELFRAPPRTRGPVPRVGMIYAEAAVKGTDVGLRAWELLKRGRSEAVLVLLSSQRPVPILPVPAGAEFHYQPSSSSLRDIYASCDVWLMPSRCEGFGLPILEAMACRTPVVATPAGAAPELVPLGAGLVVRGAEPAELAQALEQVLGLDDPAWRAMSDRACQIASEHGWDSSTQKLEQVLHDLVSRSRAAPQAAAEAKTAGA